MGTAVPLKIPKDHMDLWRIQGMSVQDRVMPLFPYRIYPIITLLPKYRSGDKVTQGLCVCVCRKRGKQLQGNIGKDPPEIFLVRVWAKHEDLAALQVVFPMAQEHVGPVDVGTGGLVRCHLCGFSCLGANAQGGIRTPGRSSAHLPAVFPFLLGVPGAE